MMTHTFTKRRIEAFTVKSLGTGSVATTDSTGFGVPEYVMPMLEVGKEYYLELYKFNDIAGILVPETGEYLFHRTDEYFAISLQKYIEESDRKRKEYYLANKEDWLKRTQALPPRYRTRIERFLAKNEDGFKEKGMGWGYELIICELAVLYEAGFKDENTVIREYSRKHGTSGNQHDVAKAWAKNPEVKI